MKSKTAKKKASVYQKPYLELHRIRTCDPRLKSSSKVLYMLFKATQLYSNYIVL